MTKGDVSTDGIEAASQRLADNLSVGERPVGVPESPQVAVRQGAEHQANQKRSGVGPANPQQGWVGMATPT